MSGMRSQLVNLLQRHSFFVSLLLHLFLLFSFVLVWLFQPSFIEENAAQYVPSYVYNDKSIAAAAQNVMQKSKPSAKDGIEKPVTPSPSTTPPSQTAKAQQTKSLGTTENKSPENVELIGDKTKTPKPLIKLLTNALGQHLSYPKIAADFKIKGTVLVGFAIHPDGQVTDVQLVKSSQADVLDEAAVSAVKVMGPVKNVDAYVSETQFLVIGVMFR